jgi:hypothetical protein
MTRPRTSPMAQPVRQWTVAENAVRFSDMKNLLELPPYPHGTGRRLPLAGSYVTFDALAAPGGLRE